MHERRSVHKMKTLGLSVCMNDLEISRAGPFSWWLSDSPSLNKCLFGLKEENGREREGGGIALLSFYILVSSCRLVLLLSSVSCF